MPPESMVDALKKIHSLLLPCGRLVDIHPAARAATGSDPPQLPGTAKIGLLQERGDFIDYGLAEEAIREVVEADLFHWERQSEFDQCVVADNPEDLFGHLENNWKRAIVDDDLRQAIDREWPRAESGSELLVSQPVCIGALRSVALASAP